MAVERLIKRTIWVAKCPECAWQTERQEASGKREVMCGGCKNQWLPFKEESFTGPELPEWKDTKK